MEKIKDIFNQYKGLNRGIYIIFIARIVNTIGSFVFPLLSLMLTQRFNLSTTRAGAYITLMSILSGLAMMVGGKIADSLGRKKVIIIFQGLAALVYIICGNLDMNMYLIYLLMLSPIFNALAQPAQSAMIMDLVEPEKRKEAFSLLYMGHNLGYAIGPLLAGVLYYRNKISLIFIGDGVTTVVSLLLLLIFVKETINNDQKEIVDGNRVLEKKVEGSVFSVLLKRPVLIYFALILFMYQFSYSQWTFALPLQLGDIFDVQGGKYYGILNAINALIVIGLTPFIVKATKKLAPVYVMSLGGFFYAIAFGSLAFFKVMPLFVVSVIILTIGEIGISINASTFAANNSPASHRGRLDATIQIIFGLGYALGPLAMGKIINIWSFKIGWIFIFFIMIIASICMLLLDRKIN
ncbi:MAG: MFS transporter [Clostridiaceae bacterium]